MDEHGYSEELANDELYCFGVEYGDGSDEDHFHVGFTSKSMLSRVNGACVYHCDGTYRILKISYPLMVLGVSDIDRKFFPVAFMISSHEKNEDYTHFFKEVKIAADTNDLDFTPSYMTIDASKAMAMMLLKQCR